jgi:hypothetical protein
MITKQNRPQNKDKPVRRINGQRITFAELAKFAWPVKTGANLSYVTGYDVRTCRRWIYEETKPPAEALAGIIAEIMRCYGLARVVTS